jgi:hypothetical protein
MDPSQLPSTASAAGFAALGGDFFPDLDSGDNIEYPQ